MQSIINLPQDTTAEQLGSDVKNISINLKNTIKKIATLPGWKATQIYLEGKKKVETAQGKSFTDQPFLDLTDARVKNLEKCSGVA